MNVSHEMDSNLNMSQKMSYGMLECNIVMLQNYILNNDFVIKDFVMENRGINCARPCIIQPRLTS